MIRGSILGAGLRLNSDAPTGLYALHVVASGGYGALMPYRASFPLYGKVGQYRAPAGGAVHTVACSLTAYAVHEDGTVRGLGGTNLGDKAGLWSIYVASANPANTIVSGPSVIDTYTITIDAVPTTYSARVMGLTLAVPAGTFPAPHVGSTQVPFAVSGQVVTAQHPLISVLPGVATGIASADMASFNGSLTAAGFGSVSGTIRQDSAGSAVFRILFPTTDLTVQYGISVYDPSASSFDQSLHPMTAPCNFSLLQG